MVVHMAFPGCGSSLVRIGGSENNKLPARSKAKVFEIDLRKEGGNYG